MPESATSGSTAKPQADLSTPGLSPVAVWKEWELERSTPQMWVERLVGVDDTGEKKAQWEALGMAISFEKRQSVAKDVLLLLRSWRDGSLGRRAKSQAEDRYMGTKALNDAHKKEAAQQATRLGKKARECAIKLARWGWLDSTPDQMLQWPNDQQHSNDVDGRTALAFCLDLEDRSLFKEWLARNPDFGGVVADNYRGAVPYAVRFQAEKLTRVGWAQEALGLSRVILDAHRKAEVDDEQKEKVLTDFRGQLWSALAFSTGLLDSMEIFETLSREWIQTELMPQTEPERAALLAKCMFENSNTKADELLKAFRGCGFNPFDRDGENRDLLLSGLCLKAKRSHLQVPIGLCTLLVDLGADCLQETQGGLSVLSLARQEQMRHNGEPVQLLVQKIEQRVEAAQEAKALRDSLDSHALERDAGLGQQTRALLAAGVLRGPDGEALSLEAFASLAQRFSSEHAAKATVPASSGAGGGEGRPGGGSGRGDEADPSQTPTPLTPTPTRRTSRL